VDGQKDIHSKYTRHKGVVVKNKNGSRVGNGQETN